MSSGDESVLLEECTTEQRRPRATTVIPNCHPEPAKRGEGSHAPTNEHRSSRSFAALRRLWMTVRDHTEASRAQRESRVESQRPQLSFNLLQMHARSGEIELFDGASELRHRGEVVSVQLQLELAVAVEGGEIVRGE